MMMVLLMVVVVVVVVGGCRVFLFVCFSHFSIFQNIRESPWSHNWAHSSPTRN